MTHCERSADFFRQPVATVAAGLIGARLLVDGVGGRVVETEAYDRDDPASHSHLGPTARNATMFGPPGHAYVYRIYGVHWCLNLVAGPEPGAAVLIRALEPTDGLATMIARRGRPHPRELCGGPGRLAQALGVTRALDGHPIDAPPFMLELARDTLPVAIGTRIGIRKAAATPWRFGLVGSAFLSRKMDP